MVEIDHQKEGSIPAAAAAGIDGGRRDRGRGDRGGGGGGGSCAVAVRKR